MMISSMFLLPYQEHELFLPCYARCLNARYCENCVLIDYWFRHSKAVSACHRRCGAILDMNNSVDNEIRNITCVHRWGP